jgi:hypothetical protein
VTPGISEASHSPALVPAEPGASGPSSSSGCATGRQVRVLSRDTHEERGGVEFVTGDWPLGDGIDAAAFETEGRVLPGLELERFR